MPRPSRAFDPGDFYADRRVLGLLGRGGMGSVYRVEHPRLVPRESAIKVLDPGIWLPPRWEVEIRHRLGEHPHVVRTLRAGHDAASGTYFHEMELLLGETLEQRVAPGVPLSPRLALELLDGVAAALEAAHAHGIVHCDLKPSNLLLVAGAGVKVLDFGIAEALGEPRTGARLGTVPYMAPEQLSGASVVPATDLWALALVAHFLLTGSRFWQARALQPLRAEILAGAACSPLLAGAEAGWPRTVHAGYRAWLLRALDPVPQRRFASAGEVLSALRTVLERVGGDPDVPWGLAHRSEAGAALAAPLTTSISSRSVAALEHGSPEHGSQVSDASLVCEGANPGRERALSPAECQTLLVARFFPRASDLVRVADDLATTSIHYLLRSPADQPQLERQLRWFAGGVTAYNEARAAYDSGQPEFRRMLAGAFGTVDDALHAALREAFRCTNEFGPAYPLPSAVPDAEVTAQHVALCVRWQRARMSLTSTLRQARRALDKLEERVEHEARQGALCLPRDPEAPARAAQLLRRYAEQAHALAESIDERFLTADFASAAQVTERLWALAPGIAALNRVFTELADQSLALRVSLSLGGGPEWRSEHKLASALERVHEFQWEICGPALNGVLVAVVGLLIGEPDEAWLAQVRAQVREWGHIVELLHSVEAPRALSTS